MAYGTERSRDISGTRRRGLLEDICAVQGRLEEFTDHHTAALDPHKADVEKRISNAINAAVKDFLGVLRDDAEALRQRHALLAPASGSGQPPKTSWFDKLTCLVDRHHTHNLIERLDNRLVAPPRKLQIQEETGRFRLHDGTSAAAKPSRRRSILVVCSYPVYVRAENARRGVR